MSRHGNDRSRDRFSCVFHTFTWPALYQPCTNAPAALSVTNGVCIRFGNLPARPRGRNPWTETFDDPIDTGWTRSGGRFRLGEQTYLNPAGHLRHGFSG